MLVFWAITPPIAPLHVHQSVTDMQAVFDDVVHCPIHRECGLIWSLRLKFECVRITFTYRWFGYKVPEATH